jgi:polyvinyl alcohol dehydrogenase (cytochrome)
MTGGSATAATAPAAAKCAGKAPGGEWPNSGADLINSRNQPAEHTISPSNVGMLTPAWTISTQKTGGAGDVTGTPIVSGGCVYFGTTSGWVYAANADTGAIVWKVKVPYGGAIYGSPALEPKRVLVGISRPGVRTGCPKGDPCKGAYAVALDRRTGKVVWASRPIDNQGGHDLYGNAVVYNGVLILGISGGGAELGPAEERDSFQGSINFLDTKTGRLLKKTYTIHPPNQPKDLYGGGAVWSTPAIDRKTGMGYVGTGNPFKPQAESPRVDAVVKFDANRRSRTFGQILAAGKGNIDEYIPSFSQLPCYDIPGNPAPYYPQGLGACGDIDMDFGAPPNIMRQPNGRVLVGAGQKSGVYHVYDAATMKEVWSSLVGPPSQFGGVVGATAYDGHSIFGPITVIGYNWSISANGGAMRWVSPLLDGLHWGPPVTVANNVVYSVDTLGTLSATDARTGLPLLRRPLMLGGTGTPISPSWGGVSVARNKVYAAVGIGALGQGYVVAYKRGTPADLAGDISETLTPSGGGGSGGAPAASGGSYVIAGPGASSTTYVLGTATTRVGGNVTFLNMDVQQHDVTADKEVDGKPIFNTPLIGLGATAKVQGLDKIAPGSYGFYCSLHRGMRGRLIVQ